MKEKNRECYFDKETTAIIKGILLILMFILHFFCFPSWYVKGIEYPKLSWLENFQGHFQICIAGFTFLTGYLYYFTKQKNFKYVVKKWKDILIPYWFVFGLLFLIAYLTNTYSGSIKTFVLEMFALERPVMFFCWYVSYYLVMIFVLWLLVRFIKNDLVKWLVALLGAYILYWACVHFIHIDCVVSTMEKFSVYFPMTVTGYLCSKRKWFENLEKLMQRKTIVCSVLLIVMVFMEPSWLYAIKIDNILFEMIRKCVRIMSIPLFVYGLIEIMKRMHSKVLKNVLNTVGGHSMLMWFIHGIFFNCSKEIFQKVLYLPQNPVLVLMWGLALCWGISIVLDLVLKPIMNKKRTV